MLETSMAALLAALAGCAAIRDAREAQSAVAPAASGARKDAATPNLSSAPLSRLVEFAAGHRPSMESAALAVEDARLAMREIATDAPVLSGTPWNAIGLSASAGYSESSKPVRARDFDGKTRRGDATATLSVELLVWDGGRNDARARAQAEKVVAAERELAKEGYAVFAEVAGAYFALRQNEALVEVAASNVVQYSEHLAQAEDRFEQGEAQKLDVLRARLDLARAAEAAVSASNDVAVAGARLLSALGIDGADGGFRAVLGERPGALEAMVRDFDDTDETAREFFDFARTNAPAMQVARANLRAASAQVDGAVADFYPEFSASLSLNWTDPLWYWRWGVSAAQSVFSGGRTAAALDRAVVAMLRARSEVEREEQTLSREIEIAVAERDSAREGLAAAETSVRQAKENLDTVSSQYEVGDVSRVDFTDAVSAYANALASRVKAFYRGQAAEAALFELAGRPPAFAGRKETER